MHNAIFKYIANFKLFKRALNASFSALLPGDIMGQPWRELPKRKGQNFYLVKVFMNEQVNKIMAMQTEVP